MAQLKEGYRAVNQWHAEGCCVCSIYGCGTSTPVAISGISSGEAMRRDSLLEQILRMLSACRGLTAMLSRKAISNLVCPGVPL